MILGENGTGKTTLLQMLAVALLPLEDVVQVAGNQGWQRYLRTSAGGNITASSFWKSEKLAKDGESPSRWGLSFWQTTIHPNPGEHSGPVAGLTGVKTELAPYFVCGYRCGRPRSSTVPTVAESEVGQTPYRFATLFGNDAGLTQPESWLRALYARSTHPEHTDADERRFALATDALEKVLPGARFDKITIDGEVLFCVDGSKVPLDRLSDGYRSTTAWTLDLVRRLCDAFPDRDDPLNAHGVVLVDEIDLHLHPRWQRTVIETVRQTFPNLQFIVTTHSPFVAQDMTENDKLIVLKRGENGAVVAEEGMGFAHRWRADQILTSWLFGLETTRGEDAQKDERDYQRLLQDQAANRLTEAQKGTLRELKERLDKDPLGETLEDQEIFAAADALIAALQHKP